MKIIKKLATNLELFFKEFPNLIIFLLLISYLKLFVYLLNYNNIFNPLNEKQDLSFNFFRYFIFSLSFISILLIVSSLIYFIIFIILKKIKFSYKKPIFILAFILEAISYIYVYSDLQLYKLMGVHLHNKIVLGAINGKDLKNDVALTSSQVISFLIKPSIILVIIFSIFFLLIYLKTKFNLNEVFKKLSIIISLPIFLSLFIVLYFWINLYDELTAIPLWSYIESSHLADNFESTYGDGFNYDNIKIKNKKNVLIIVAESFRKDVFNEENTPNLFHFSQKEKGLIISKNHFSGAHFTVNSIISLWYSIYGYHDKALFNNSNYKQPLPIKIFNKLGYDTQFFTTSLLIPSLKSIKKATETFKEYKTFKNDLSMIEFFKNYYLKKDKEQLFFTTIFLNSTHYEYNFPAKIAKYKPYILEKNIKLNSEKMTKAYKKELFNRYKNSVLYVDYLFNKILNILTTKDKKNTIIIFIGDHGEQFWEYNYFGHTKTSYVKEAVSTPLIFYIPDLDKNIDVNISSHLDIMPTLLSYITNIKQTDIAKFFNGVSLLNINANKNRYFVVSSFNFMGLKTKIALINNYGKLILKSKTNKMKDKNLFKIIKFTDFKDKKIANKFLKNKLLNSFNDFKKNYLRFIEMDKK